MYEDGSVGAKFGFEMGTIVACFQVLGKMLRRMVKLRSCRGVPDLADSGHGHGCCNGRIYVWVSLQFVFKQLPKFLSIVLMTWQVAGVCTVLAFVYLLAARPMVCCESWVAGLPHVCQHGLCLCF